MILLSFLFPMAFALGPCEHDATSFRCVKVVSNYDGDTIKVNIPGVPDIIGKGVGVRVRGIDTPEMHGSGRCEKEQAEKAKLAVSTALKNAKHVDLLHIGRDKYFRILADVSLDGNSLAQLLMSEGLAVPYDGGTKLKQSWCKAK